MQASIVDILSNREPCVWLKCRMYYTSGARHIMLIFSCIVLLLASGCYEPYLPPDPHRTHLAYSPTTDELFALRKIEDSVNLDYGLYLVDQITGTYTQLTTVQFPFTRNDSSPPRLYGQPTDIAFDANNNQLIIAVASIGLLSVDLQTYNVSILSAVEDTTLGPSFDAHIEIVMDEVRNRVIAVTDTESLASYDGVFKVLSIDLQTGVRQLLFSPPPPAGLSADSQPTYPRPVACCLGLEIINDSIYVLFRNILYSIDLQANTHASINLEISGNIRLIKIPNQSQLVLINIDDHSLSTYNLQTHLLEQKIAPKLQSQGTRFLPGLPTNIHPTGRAVFSNEQLFISAPYSMVFNTYTEDYLHRVDLTQGEITLHDLDRFTSIEWSESGISHQRRMISDIWASRISDFFLAVTLQTAKIILVVFAPTQSV